MKTKFIEATNNDQNWGKFVVAQFDEEEWLRPSEISDLRASLLRQRGWEPGHIWVMDIETGEGFFTRPGGLAAADLRKHAIWVCPLFEPFLSWLYQHWKGSVDDLPAVVQLPDAEFAMRGYRRPGYWKNRPIESELREMIRESGLDIRRIAKEVDVKRARLLKFIDGEQSLNLEEADRIVVYLGSLRAAPVLV